MNEKIWDGWKQCCNDLRAQCLVIETKARDMKNADAFGRADEAFPGQHGEMKAQVMLAVRHLEDARMRLGKAIQYSRDGVSIFDAPPTGGAEPQSA